MVRVWKGLMALQHLLRDGKHQSILPLRTPAMLLSAYKRAGPTSCCTGVGSLGAAASHGPVNQVDCCQAYNCPA